MLASAGSVMANHVEDDSNVIILLVKQAQRLLNIHLLSSPSPQNDIKGYKLKSAISVYILDENQISPLTTVEFHPIFNQGEFTHILTINGANDDYPTYSISEDFSDELNSARYNNMNGYCLIM